MPFKRPPAKDLIDRLAFFARCAAAIRTQNADDTLEGLNLDRLAQRLPSDMSSDTLASLPLYQVYFQGTDWNGPFDRPSYLCLNEAEAKMVVNETQGPRPAVSRLYFTSYFNARYEPVALSMVLADPDLQKEFATALHRCTLYSAPQYDRAASLVFWWDRGHIGFWLFDADNQLILPDDPEQTLPTDASWFLKSSHDYQIVWSPQGLGGVLTPSGRFAMPCHFAYLSNPKEHLIEAREQSLPAIQSTVNYWDFLNYTCTIYDCRTGQRVNPPEAPALVNSLSFHGIFVAVAPHGRLGFMNEQGSWVGEPRWVDLLLFNEKRAAVKCPDTDLWGFIDEGGTLVIPPTYAKGCFFNRGRAMVSISNPATPDNWDWWLIDEQGATLSGPWRDIDADRGDTYRVQDQTGQWGLIDHNGKIRVAPFAIPDATTEDDITSALRAQDQQQRRAQAQILNQRPLAEAVAHLTLRNQRDFMDLGLWGRKVQVVKLPEHWSQRIATPAVGHLGWDYSASASLFDFKAEAPVTFNQESGGPVVLGIPWDDLTLITG